jgi:RHS repeat-associated protein
MNGGEYQHSYIYGLDAALELRQYLNGVGSILTQQMYFVHDGHGSVRAVTDQNGAVTDTYDYDAFGNLIHQTGTTPNNYLFAGEQFDSDLNLYYNRARYLNTATARFFSGDTYEGSDQAPISLHRYLYAANDPIDWVDPTGLFTQSFGYEVEWAVWPYYKADHPGDIVIRGLWARTGPNPSLKPDIFNFTARKYLEIKPLSTSGVIDAEIKMVLNAINFGPSGYGPDKVWEPAVNPLVVDGTPTYIRNVGGVLFYTDVRDNFEDLAGVATIQAIKNILTQLLLRPGKVSEFGNVIDFVRKTNGGIAAQEAEIETQEGAAVLEDVA